MASKEKGDIVMLMEGSQLLKLNDLIRNTEESLMGDIESESESDRATYLKECNDAHHKIVTLLNKCNDLNSNDLNDFSDKSMQESKIIKADTHKVTHDYLNHALDIIMDRVQSWCKRYGWIGLLENLELESKLLSEKYINLRKRYTYDHNKEENNVVNADDNDKDIQAGHDVQGLATDIQEYVKYAINVSLQCARNCCARRRWVSNIEAHFEMLAQELEEGKQSNMQGMAEHVSLYKECMLEFTRNCQRGSIWPDSTAYFKLLKKEKMQFSDMATKRKMNELGFAGEFNSLTESQKLEVWRGIINESGRAIMPDLEVADQGSTLAGSESKSSRVASPCLLIEFIFGKGSDTIRDFTKPTFYGARMPDGMVIARQIEAKERELKMKGNRQE